MSHKLILYALALIVAVAGCQAVPSNDSINQNVSFIRPPAENAPRDRFDARVSGVPVSVFVPAGWRTDASNGLIIVDHSSADRSGVLAYLFIPPLDDLVVYLPDAVGADGLALTVLRQIVTMPAYVGDDVAIAPPQPFRWGDHAGAYYLIASGDGVHALVMALPVPGQPGRLLVANISAPAAHSQSIRRQLPLLLDGMTIGTTVFSGADLQGLPDPLPFPTNN